MKKKGIYKGFVLFSGMKLHGCLLFLVGFMEVHLGCWARPHFFPLYMHNNLWNWKRMDGLLCWLVQGGFCHMAIDLLSEYVVFFCFVLLVSIE